MSKAEQLIEYITQDIIAFIVEDNNVEYDEAMRLFYGTDIFEKVQDTDTGLYLESFAYVYDLFKNEQQNGRLIQMEE